MVGIFISLKCLQNLKILFFTLYFNYYYVISWLYCY